MAQVANCPQCKHELIVPDGTVADSWSRCPECRAAFQLKDAKLREVSALEIVDSVAETNDGQKQTVADFSSKATWSGDAEDDLNSELAEFTNEWDRERLHIADELDDATPIADDEPEDANHQVADDAQGDVKDDEPLTMEERTEEESPEAAAQRIDAWFKSAKTLPDVPPLPEESPIEKTLLEKSKVDFVDSKYLDDREIDSARPADSDAPIDMGSDDLAEIDLGDDVDVEPPAEAPQGIAPWDDAQHMDRLLAELEDKPQDEFVPSDQTEAAEYEDTHAQAADEWSPSEAVATAPMSSKRPRSIVRTMVATVLGGVVAIPLAGYTLLWLKGPEADFLGLANYLPKTMLPASFNSSPQQTLGGPTIAPKAEETPSEPVAETTPNAGDSPAEKQASFTEPVNAEQAKATTETPAEPAAFDAPPAVPVKENAAQSEPVRIKDAPSFSATDVSAALQTAKDAEPGLVNGSMSDGREVAQAKGASYSKLADLAQKATFVDADNAPAESAKLEQESDALFRKVFSTAHTREEVAQIVLMWIASPNRRHGGVFFAGSVASHENKGTVSECSIDLGSGKPPLPVLLPAAAGEQLKAPTSPVIVVGWLIDKPAEQVPGYAGTAQQAVFASKLIPLE
jgi:hypothetical protein